MKVPASGPASARIMIVGEAPGADEERAMRPFVGTSGRELDRMLSEAGIDRHDCYVTNVCKYRPPKNKISEWFYTKTFAKKHNVPEIMKRYPNESIKEGLLDLYNEIENVSPQTIIALGDTALWAVTGQSGITKWRGSELSYEGIRVIPTYHPAAILRMWSWRPIAIHDLRKVNNTPQRPHYRFITRPIYSQVMEYLNLLENKLRIRPVDVAVDIETRGGFIACIGLAQNATDALCIPFMSVERPQYWNIDDWTNIVITLRRILSHKRCNVIGQNFSYDAQYIARYLGFIPNLTFDTMVAQHVLFAGMPKGLDFLSSLYLDYHEYWKDEGKNWDPAVAEDQLWVYNCKDCVATWAVAQEQDKALDKQNLRDPFDFQMRLWRPVLKMMLRGVRLDNDRRAKLALELNEAMIERQDFMNFVLRRSFNPRSTPQMRALFYDELKTPVIRHKKTGQPTLAAGALEKLRKKCDPILYPVIDAILEFRQLGTFYSTFVNIRLDTDGRIRTSYNIAGPETYRFSSSEDAFGFGGNLQNIPKGDE